MTAKDRTGMVRRLGVAAALALGVFATAQAPALAAQAAQVTVTPSQNLTDGQSVTVSVTGAQPGTEYFIGLCGSVNGAEACDPSSAKTYRTDAAGNASFAFVVHKSFQGVSPTGEVVGSVDCAATACSVGTGRPGEDIGNVQLGFVRN
ncbi:enediyne antibiotic chromoprotein [Streptomyces sp. NPDC053048]|uniref:enediyne antibiotic chromoprotein n=1 Tax=Streptomyces sp. NPDC053048 TaxID=3365694 RepID=UPI0037D86CE2